MSDRLGMPIVRDTPETLKADAEYRDVADIENRFTYHPPKPGQPEKYGLIRESALKLALQLQRLCPRSREFSTALTKLDEVVFFANAAIARNE